MTKNPRKAKKQQKKSKKIN